MTRRRVLLMAEAANPEWVSSSLIAWSHYMALARRVDVVLATQIRNREALLRAGVPAERLVTIDSERLAAPLWRLSNRLRGGNNRGWTTVRAVGAPGYYYFEHLLWRALHPRIRAGEFDLVHRLTPVSPAWPSPIARRLARVHVPFIIGPLNGGLPWPPGYGDVKHREGEWLSAVRNLYKLLPGYRSTREYASAIVVGSRTTLEQVPLRWRHKCVYVPENAIDPRRFEVPIERPAPARPLRAAFVGRLVAGKGVDVLLEASAPLVRRGELIIDVIGDGPERPRLRELAERERLACGVRLDGWVPHADLAQRLVKSELFVFPSVHEFGGGAILEAMVLGLVPIAVDYGGPAELVTPETGYLLPIEPRSRMIERLREQLAALVANPTPLSTLGQAARQRVLDHFTWDRKAAQMLEIYEWVLAPSRRPPDFGLPLSRIAGAEAKVQEDRPTS